MNLQATLDELRAQRDKIDQAIEVLEGLNGSGPRTARSFAFKRTPKAAKKPRRVSNALRPTSGRTGAKGKRGATRARVEAYLEGHPGASQSQIGNALGISQATAGYHLGLIRKANART